MAQGFEIYRTVGDQVVLADRVRDNLIMDSGVAAVAGDALRVRLVAKVQSSTFPGEDEGQLFARARGVVADASDRGYSEAETKVVEVKDPGDSSRTLDTWYEVAFEREVDSEDALTDELRYALGLEKTPAH